MENEHYDEAQVVHCVPKNPSCGGTEKASSTVNEFVSKHLSEIITDQMYREASESLPQPTLNQV